MGFRIETTDKATGKTRLSVSEFDTEELAIEHLELLRHLASNDSRHKHFNYYDYVVVSMKKKRVK